MLYRQDQQGPFHITGTGLTHLPLWEAVGSNDEHAGIFSPRLGSTSPLFTPYNRTQNAKVIVYDAIKPSLTTTFGAYLDLNADDEEIGYTVDNGLGGYVGATGVEVCASGDCFVESKITGPVYNRGFGLSATGGDYSWASSNFDYAIALGQLNMASIWIDGIPVAGAGAARPGIIYRDGDIFRVAVESGSVCFRQNGKLLHRFTPAAPPTGMRPLISFFIPATKLGEVRFWQSSYGMAVAPDMQIMGVIPICQDKVSEHEITEIAEISEAEAQRGRDKIVRYHSQHDKWDLYFSGRRLSELQALRDFRAFHRIHLPFYIADQARGLDKLVVFETGIKDRLIQQNMFDFNCTVKEY
jgi:hypothetical protein